MSKLWIFGEWGLKLDILAEYFDDQFYDELYNLGTSENTTDKVATTNNTSSSTADLKILTQTEISLLKEVLERISKDDLNLLLKEDLIQGLYRIFLKRRFESGTDAE